MIDPRASDAGTDTDPTTPPVLDARTLRLLAEAADGQRDEDLAIFFDGKGYAVSPADRQDGTKLVDVFTPPRTRGRRKVQKLVHIQVPGSELQPLPEDVDSIFWSESAIEKFVLPYYQRLLTTAEMADLVAAHEDPNVLAILHIKPSIYRSVRAVEEIGVVISSAAIAGALEVIPLTAWARRRR